MSISSYPYGFCYYSSSSNPYMVLTLDKSPGKSSTTVYTWDLSNFGQKGKPAENEISSPGKHGNLESH